MFLAYLNDDENKPYVIKVFRKDVLVEGKQDYDAIAAAEREKDIMLEVDHPFLCGMDYMFQNETRLFFVMPYIRGAEMYTFLQTVTRLKESDIKFYAVQIILGIGYLHETMKFAHRDIKLENTLLDSDGYIKLIDYGTAEKIDTN